MEIVELLKELINLNIHPRHYSIGPEIKDNAYNIERVPNGHYAVYYLERGEKIGRKVFDTEEKALAELIASVKGNLKHGLDLSK